MSIIQQAWDLVSSRGGWSSVYTLYPSVMQAATKSQVPCPFTGKGDTKFRLYKDWEDSGAGFHNDLGRIPSGIDMIMHLEPSCENNPGKAAKHIIKLLGGTVAPTQVKHVVSNRVPILHEDEIKKRAGTLRALMNSAQPSAGHRLYKSYCESRGIPAIPCADLLVATNVYHRDEHATVSRKNAILGVMRKPDGSVATVHRLYLGENGHGIKGAHRKMMLPPPCQKKELLGSAIRLAPTRKGPRGNILALTEGIETGLAVMAGSGLPTWSCYSTALLEAVQIPKEVEKVIIFADYDYNGGAGLDSAETLAVRLRQEGFCVRILVPMEPPGFDKEGKKGVDWLDVYNCSRREFVKQVRECLLLDL